MAFTVSLTSVSDLYLNVGLGFFECGIFVILLDLDARAFYSANALHSPGTTRPRPYASIFENAPNGSALGVLDQKTFFTALQALKNYLSVQDISLCTDCRIHHSVSYYHGLAHIPCLS